MMKEKPIHEFCHRFLFLLLLPVLFTQMSCSHVVEPIVPKEESSNGILPLKVGYYWKYKNYYLKSDGSISGERIEEGYKITKYSSIKIETEEYKVFHRISGYFDPSINQYRYGSDEWLFRNFDNGLYLMGGNYRNDSINTKLLWYKYPVKKGDTWKSPHLVYNLIEQKYMIKDSTIYTCTETDALFETPLGNFICVVYYHRVNYHDYDVYGIEDIFEYYTEGVGLVGFITYGYDEKSKLSYPGRKKILFETNVNSKQN